MNVACRSLGEVKVACAAYSPQRSILQALPKGKVPCPSSVGRHIKPASTCLTCGPASNAPPVLASGPSGVHGPRPGGRQQRCRLGLVSRAAPGFEPATPRCSKQSNSKRCHTWPGSSAVHSIRPCSHSLPLPSHLDQQARIPVQFSKHHHAGFRKSDADLQAGLGWLECKQTQCGLVGRRHQTCLRHKAVWP